METLLAAGADVGTDANGTALSRAGSREIIRRLLDAGANPADLPHDGQRTLLGLGAVEEDAADVVSPDDPPQSFSRIFGRKNPEKMANRFWEAMVRNGIAAHTAGRRIEALRGPVAGPVWCAQRFGQSFTLLTAGRAIQIGGEHEDGYDPDFCIYNDVLVHAGDGTIAIYGYPETVFPPTDFHTATLIGDHIYVIGRLGYHGTRRPGFTPLYRLNIHSLRMESLDAGGEPPGWLYKHRAAVVGTREIRAWGGIVVTAGAADGRESHEENRAVFVLNLDRLLWRREPEGLPNEGE